MLGCHLERQRAMLSVSQGCFGRWLGTGFGAGRVRVPRFSDGFGETGSSQRVQQTIPLLAGTSGRLDGKYPGVRLPARPGYATPIQRNIRK